MTFWPLSLALVRRDLQLMQERVKFIEAELKKAADRETYWRERYERVADSMLFRNGDIAQPVHVDVTKTTGREPVGTKVMRIANLAGNATGVDFRNQRGHGSAADLPTH